MGTLLDVLSAAASPELIDSAAKLLGVTDNSAAQAAGLLGPTLIASLARQAEGPDGAARVSALLSRVGATTAADSSDLLSSAMLGRYGDVVGEMLGDSAAPLMNDLTRATGIPGFGAFLRMAAPVGIAALAAEVERRGLDEKQIAAALKAEAKEVQASDDPKAQTVALAFENIDAQAALRKQFTDDQWQAVSAFPALAAGYVAAVGISGPFGSIKEFAALTKALDPSTVTAGSTLLDAVWNSMQGAVDRAAATGDLGEIGLDRFDARDAAAVKARVLDVGERAWAALSKLPPEEAAAYRNATIKAATAVAESSKEGGFLGIGGAIISDSERAALESIRRVLGV
jgi:hypothetical protein